MIARSSTRKPTDKITSSTCVKDRHTGFCGKSEQNVPGDLKLFPRYLQRQARDAGAPRFARPRGTGPAAPKGDADRKADIACLKLGALAEGAAIASARA